MIRIIIIRMMLDDAISPKTTFILSFEFRTIIDFRKPDETFGLNTLICTILFYKPFKSWFKLVILQPIRLTFFLISRWANRISACRDCNRGQDRIQTRSGSFHPYPFLHHHGHRSLPTLCLCQFYAWHAFLLLKTNEWIKHSIKVSIIYWFQDKNVICSLKNVHFYNET